MTDGRRAEFEVVFGIAGAWTRLLYGAEGYLMTEAWCESLESRQYRVRDFWAWHRSFEDFRSRFQSEGGRILSDGLIEKEQFLGAYYEELGGEEDDGSVLI